VQRRWAELLTHGEWTPLAARSENVQVVGSRWLHGGDELWALANLADESFDGEVSLAGRAVPVGLPPLGLAAVTPDGVSVFGGGSSDYPARDTVRIDPPLARVDTVPDGFVAVDPQPTRAR